MPSGEIELNREKYIAQILDGIHSLLQEYRDDKTNCTSECDSMNLGSLTKHMYKLGLYEPRPVPPFSGTSVHELIGNVRKFRDPEWHHYCDTYSASHRLNQLLRTVEKGIVGLNSNDMGGCKS